ncbi:hypothetical protein ACHAWF_018637 [Thalassiosira exigua]
MALAASSPATADAAVTFVVNGTAEGTWQELIKDPNTSDWIGEKYRFVVEDPATGAKLGTLQGYSFNFNNLTSFNGNNVLLYDDGSVINFIDDYILSATGEYAPLTGGYYTERVLTRDPYVAEVSMFEPPPPRDDEDDADSAAPSTFSFLITSGGGYYVPFLQNGTDGGDPEEIGQMFQNPAYTKEDGQNATTDIGINQGYSYQFPDDAFITEVLGGYSGSYQKRENYHYQGNRRFLLDEGNMTVFNEVVVQATGVYEVYKGTSIQRMVISSPPLWVSEVTLEPPSADHGGDAEGDDASPPTEFTITAAGGWYDPIVDPDTGSQIGERFQNPVYLSNGTRVGTNQGYAFNFPNDTGCGNRIFYMIGGTMNVFNEFVVAATGEYEAYVGGAMVDTVVTSNPNYVGKVKLVPPRPLVADEAEAEQVDDGGSVDGDTQQSEGNRSGACLWCVAGLSWTLLLVRL